MDITSGTRFGPYEIQGSLGSGGMGEVYRATDTRLNRTVAIKVLSSHLSTRPDVHERFEREARAVSSLNHPHICTLYDIGKQDDIDYLVMECLEGETLQQRLSKGPLSLDQAFQFAIEIAGALETAHDQGIVHRDLKPGNVMLTKSGAKVLDFGLAKFSRDAGAKNVGASALPTQSNPLTAEGTILGTVQYMAPEQLEGGEADERSDIFAFGALLYEMITGKKAFEGKSQVSVMAAIMNIDPPSMSQLAPASPPVLDHLLKGCLAKSPSERWRSFHDVRKELQWIAAEGTQLAGSPVLPVSSKRTSFAIWVTAGALLAAAAASLITYKLRTPGVPETVQFKIQAPPDTTFRIGSINGINASADPWPSPSPDGHKLAFVARRADGKTQIFVRHLDAIDSQPLPGTENSELPFWSPDSRYLGFFADGKLKKIDTFGGPPQTLCDAPLQGGLSGSWASDGTIIFVYRNLIYRTTLNGGPPEAVTALDASRKEATHLRPVFLPDGRHFLFIVQSLVPDTAGLYVASLDSKDKKRVLSAPAEVRYSSGHLIFQRNGILTAQPFDLSKLEVFGSAVSLAEGVGGAATGVAAFSASPGGLLAYRKGLPLRTSLTWYDRNGRQMGTIGEPGTYAYPEVSPDGKTVAVDLDTGGNRDVWLFDTLRGTSSRLTFDAHIDGAPVWSPDGKQIAFFSDRSGKNQLYVRNSTGTGQEELVVKTDDASAPRQWTRDGRYLIYRATNAKTGSDIWALPLFGERKPFPLAQTPFEEVHSQVSPDGRWLAYSSNETARYELYVQPFPGGGGRWQVSNTADGGVQPVWRQDGKEIFYMTAVGEIMAADVLPGVNFQTGSPRKLFTVSIVTPTTVKNSYTVSSDGQKFLVNSIMEEKAPWEITVITNWTAILKH